MKVRCSNCRRYEKINKNTIHCTKCDRWYCERCWVDFSDECWPTDNEEEAKKPRRFLTPRGKNGEFVCDECDECL